MVRNTRAAELRAEAAARRAAATRKVRRLENAGVKISGTQYDPRKPAKTVKTYSAARLEKYVGQLNAFIDRSNQFAAGMNGTPLPGDAVREYRRAERRYNNMAENRFGQIADVKLPGSDETIGERRAKMRTNFRKPQANQTASPFVPVNRNIKGVTSVEALKALTAKVREQSTKEYFAESAKIGRERVSAMLGDRGMQKLGARLDKLSDKAFHMLWSTTRFSEYVAQKYIAIRDAATTSNNPRMMEELLDDTYAEGDNFVEWAEKIDAKQKAPRKSGRRL